MKELELKWPQLIQLCAPEIRGNEWTYVKDCLDSTWVSSVGQYVDRFEQEFAKRIGAGYGVSTVNGTSAIHIALLVAGVKPNEEVLVSNLTFIAPANAIRYVGAWPVFIDSEPDHWQFDVNKATEFIEVNCDWKNGELWNRLTGRQITAILPVHILGHPVDLDAVMSLSEKYDLCVIEDATESLGAKYREKETGSFGRFGCYSFNGNKLLTTGGGGMLITHSADDAKKAKRLTTQAKDDPIEYIHSDIGFNYRLTNLQAAIGCAQLEKIDDYLQAKASIATRYCEELNDVPGLAFLKQSQKVRSANWLFTVLFDPHFWKIGSRDVMKQLLIQNVQTRPLWQPMHMSPAHRGSAATDCSVSSSLYANALSLPCSVGLTSEEQGFVIRCIFELAKVYAT